MAFLACKFSEVSVQRVYQFAGDHSIATGGTSTVLHPPHISDSQQEQQTPGDTPRHQLVSPQIVPRAANGIALLYLKKARSPHFGFDQPEIGAKKPSTTAFVQSARSTPVRHPFHLRAQTTL